MCIYECSDSSKQAKDSIYSEVSSSMSFMCADEFRHLLPHHVRTDVEHGDVCIDQQESSQREEDLPVRIEGRREQLCRAAHLDFPEEGNDGQCREGSKTHQEHLEGSVSEKEEQGCNSQQYQSTPPHHGIVEEMRSLVGVKQHLEKRDSVDCHRRSYTCGNRIDRISSVDLKMRIGTVFCAAYFFYQIVLDFYCSYDLYVVSSFYSLYYIPFRS